MLIYINLVPEYGGDDRSGSKSALAALKCDFRSTPINAAEALAIVHHGRLDAGVLLLAKPYISSDLARMIRTALAS